MKIDPPTDWKAQVLGRIDKETGFTGTNGKRHFSPMYTWAEGLFSNPANDENWAMVAKQLPVNVVTDALAVCRQALFSFPARKSPDFLPPRPRIHPRRNGTVPLLAHSNLLALCLMNRCFPWIPRTETIVVSGSAIRPIDNEGK